MAGCPSLDLPRTTLFVGHFQYKSITNLIMEILTGYGASGTTAIFSPIILKPNLELEVPITNVDVSEVMPTLRRKDFGSLLTNDDGSMPDPDFRVSECSFWLDMPGLQADVDGDVVRFFSIADIKRSDGELKLVFGDQIGDQVFVAAAVNPSDVSYLLMMSIKAFNKWIFPPSTIASVVPDAGEWVKANLTSFLKEICIWSPKTNQTALIKGPTEELFLAEWERAMSTFMDHMTSKKTSKSSDYEFIFGNSAEALPSNPNGKVLLL